MKKLTFAVLIATFLSTGNVFACDKWKSEISSTAWNLGKYIKVYSQYVASKIDQSKFRTEADEAIEKLEKVKSRLNSIPSCSHPEDKYEKRKQSLSKTLDLALPIMRSGGHLADSVKKTLTNPDKDND